MGADWPVSDDNPDNGVPEVIGTTEVLLAVGTRKGLFIARRRGGGPWESDASPYFNAQAAPRSRSTPGHPPRLLAGGDSAHWGPSVFHLTTSAAPGPNRPGSAVKFPKDTGASLERVWQLHPGRRRAGRGVRGHGTGRAVPLGGPRRELRAGPPAVEHPTRAQWVPGGGGEGLHTVPTDA